jgi:hypothetical protein
MSGREGLIYARCEDVTFDMGDGSYEAELGWWEGGGVGSLVWNPKGGEGHVLIAEVPCEQPMGVGQHPERRANCGCDGYFGGCKSTATVCECGEDNSWRDHHYRLLRKA